MRVHSSREATPKQIEKLLNITQETKAGGFGMPIYPVDPSKDFQMQTYRLVEVEDLPYGHEGGEALADLEYDFEDIDHILRGRQLYKSRLFWPSLEVALGFRKAGFGSTSSIDQEIGAMTHQWAAPFYEERFIKEFGYTYSPNEVPRLEGHQTFPSDYAESLGKHVLDITIRASNDLRDTEHSESYVVQYNMSKHPPRDTRSRPGFNFRDPRYEAEFRLREWEGEPTGYKNTYRHIGLLAWIGTRSRGSTIKRDEADYVAADLERVKEFYSQWS